MAFRISLAVVLCFFTIVVIGCSRDGGDGGDSGPNLVQIKNEGTSNGGGGKGVICNAQVQVLDLYEAKLSGRKLSPSAGSVGQNLMSVAGKVMDYLAEPGEPDSKTSPEQFGVEIEKMFDVKAVYLPKGQSLPSTNDATIPLLLKECQVVQIAVWAVDGHIYIDQMLWDQMDGQNQAALVLHEFIYTSARESGAINSDESRKLVADVFSPVILDPKFGVAVNAYSYGWCGAGGGSNKSPVYEFFFADDSQIGVPGVKFYFRTLNDNLMLTQTMGFVGNISLQSVFKGRTANVGSNIKNSKRNQEWSFQISFKPRQESTTNQTSKNKVTIEIKTWDKMIPSAKVDVSSGFCQLETKK